jgi:hypothetical protein
MPAISEKKMEGTILIIVTGTIKSLICYIDDNNDFRSYALVVQIFRCPVLSLNQALWRMKMSWNP